MTDTNKAFIIYGHLSIKQTQQNIEGFTVEALDKDLLSDDRLGCAQSDKDGYYEIKYAKSDFKQLFFDNKPDIYLRIKNRQGEVIHTTERKVKYEAAGVEQFDIQLSAELLDKVVVEHERLQFKQLLAMNPNYFGNLDDKTSAADYSIVFPLANKTKYEKLSCVGLYPADNLLEAVIEVKKPYGYNGSLCSQGSKEYVAFYIDYDDGNGFVSTGAAAQVNVHNLNWVNGGHPYYGIRKAFTPLQYLKCQTPQIVKVRAILSWQQIPTGPNFNPVWGNVMDVYVQIKPKTGIIVVQPPAFELAQLAKYELNELTTKVPLPPFPPVEQLTLSGDKHQIKAMLDASIAAEKQIKADGNVEPERMEFSQLIAKNPNYFGAISAATDQHKLKQAVQQLPQLASASLLPQFEIDPDWLIPVQPIKYNTSYEQMTCVGLHPESDLLEAVIEVKKPYGFNGGLCTLGSKQYVAFYIDYHDGGGFVHAATATVAAHDIPQVSDHKLYYALKAVIPNIEDKLKTCSIENIVRVKAILSWNQDPTPYGHTHTPTWGNVMQRDVQLRPIDGATAHTEIEIVNEVHVDDIRQFGASAGMAIKIDGGGNAVPLVFDRPLGGTIGCWGKINVPGASYYRFRSSDDSGGSWNSITDKRIARHPSIFISTLTRTPDSNGWFSISDYFTDVANYALVALGHWNSRGKNGKVMLRLELADGGKTPLAGQTDDITLMLDNKGVEFFEFGGTPAPLPSEGVVVKNAAGNYKKCGQFVGPEAINIWGNFADEHFKAYSLTVFGGNITVSGVHINSGRYDSGIPGIDHSGIIGAHDGGAGLQLHPLNLCTIAQDPASVKCAYGIRLSVSDRAVVGYVRGYEYDTTSHGRHGYVTFDWDPAGC